MDLVRWQFIRSDIDSGRLLVIPVLSKLELTTDDVSVDHVEPSAVFVSLKYLLLKLLKRMELLVLWLYRLVLDFDKIYQNFTTGLVCFVNVVLRSFVVCQHGKVSCRLVDSQPARSSEGIKAAEYILVLMQSRERFPPAMAEHVSVETDNELEVTHLVA